MLRRVGGSLTDLGAFSVEAGRALCPTIVHGTIHAGLVIDALGNPEQREALLPALASGRRSATTALWSAVDASVVTPALRAEADGASWTLRGSVDFVLDAQRADDVLVSARDVATGRTLVFVVPMHADSLRVDPLTLMGGQAAARLHFDGVTVDDGLMVLGGDEGVADDQLHRIANIATALLSLDLVGVGEAALQRTVDYTTMRHQFGRPIASFQAAQHLVANMHIALSAARLAARAAVSLLGRGRHRRRARPLSPACTRPPPPSWRPSMRTNCTVAWAMSSTPTCTGTRNGRGCSRLSAAAPTSRRPGCERARIA